MSVRSGQSIVKEFTLRDPSTSAAANGDSTPTGTLFVNGTADAAAVTVTNQATGRYKAAVTLPTLALGDLVELLVTATVGGVTDSAIVWWDSKDLALDSSYRPGIDWSNVGAPATTLGLSGTTVKTATDVEADTADIQSRLPAALGANGNMKADLRDSLGVAVTNYDGVAQGGTSTTITLAASSSSVDDFYNGRTITLTGNTGDGQGRFVTDYNGTTKVATVHAAWTTTPDSTTQYVLDQTADANATHAAGTAWASGAIVAGAVSAAAANKLADHARRRKQSNVEASADGDALDDARSQYGAIQQVQESNTTAHAGKLTVYQTDGTTELEQLTLATSASADAVTGIS